MIRFCLGIIVCFLCFILWGQEVTKKDIGSSSYGGKKFRKAPKKIYISGFDVYYQMTASATAEAKSNANFSKGSASSSMTIAINGVDIPELTKITNSVYQDLVKELEAAGFEVINAEEVAGIPFYKDRQLLEGNMNSAQLPGYIKATPEGFKYFVKKITKKGKERSGITENKNNPKASKQLDDAILLYVSYNFRAFEIRATQSTGLGIAKVKGRTALSLQQAEFSLGYGNPAGLAFTALIWNQLKKPVPIEGVFEDDDEKFRQIASGSYTPSYSGFMTGNHKNITHQADCDPEKYMAATSSMMKKWNDLGLEEFFSYLNK